MNLTQFLKRFDTEVKCIAYLRQQREQQGLSCYKCNHAQMRWISTRLAWTCNKCSYRMGLRKGTVMENSKLPYRLWLTCMYLMVVTKKGYSAHEMRRLLGHKRYEPIWLMMHKLRVTMGNRDAKYVLDGFIEFDDAFFAGHRQKPDEQTGFVPKEIDRNEKVLVAVNVADGNAKYLKMTVVQSLQTKEINYELPNMLAQSAEVITDGRRSYKGIKEHVTKHTVHIIKNKKEVCKTFPWVHTAISNAKRKINGIHHHVKNDYMQNYLNEFAYKFNRRQCGIAIFDKLIIAALSSAWFLVV
jgi:ribosomal protein L37AE/L43A